MTTGHSTVLMVNLFHGPIHQPRYRTWNGRNPREPRPSASFYEFSKTQRPLNSIGVPYFDSQLLSAWPPNLSPKVSSSPTKIPLQVLASMKYNENVAYATLPKELRGRRNMTNSVPRKGISRFRSGKTDVPEASFCP